MESNSYLRYFYGELYASIDAQGPLGWFHRLTHRKLEGGLSNYSAVSVLEIGVNRGEHLAFVKHRFDYYVATDFRITNLALQDRTDSVIQAACSAESLPFSPDSFDRVILTCVLHHLDNPLEALSEIRRVVRPNGLISILLPCDPGLAYRASWAATSKRRLQKLGVSSPELYHAVEHSSHFAALRTFALEAFKSDQIQTEWWPWHIPSWNLNLFTILSITVRK